MPYHRKPRPEETVNENWNTLDYNGKVNQLAQLNKSYENLKNVAHENEKDRKRTGFWVLFFTVIILLICVAVAAFVITLL